MPDKQFYSTGEVARITGISQRTIMKYCSKGKIPVKQTPVTNFRRIPREGLVGFMKEYKIPLDLLDKREKKKILIVDDDRGVVDSIKWVLEDMSDSIMIRTANDGYEACIMAGDFKPDIIILDLMMPRVDGFEVCEKIKEIELTRHAEIIILTGYATEENIQRLKKYDINHVITKPFDKDTFTEIIKAALTA